MKTNNVIKAIKKGIFLALLIVSGSAFAQDKDYTKELDAIFNAFKDKDYSLIENILDPNVKIHPNIPQGMNIYVIPQVLEQLPSPESYEVLKKEVQDGNVKYTTEYRYADSKPRLQYFVFNKDGKAIELDILQDATKVEASTQFAEE